MKKITVTNYRPSLGLQGPSCFPSSLSCLAHRKPHFPLLTRRWQIGTGECRSLGIQIIPAPPLNTCVTFNNVLSCFAYEMERENLPIGLLGDKVKLTQNQPRDLASSFHQFLCRIPKTHARFKRTPRLLIGLSRDWFTCPTCLLMHTRPWAGAAE